MSVSAHRDRNRRPGCASSLATRGATGAGSSLRARDRPAGGALLRLGEARLRARVLRSRGRDRLVARGGRYRLPLPARARVLAGRAARGPPRQRLHQAPGRDRARANGRECPGGRPRRLPPAARGQVRVSAGPGRRARAPLAASGAGDDGERNGGDAGVAGGRCGQFGRVLDRVAHVVAGRRLRRPRRRAVRPRLVATAKQALSRARCRARPDARDDRRADGGRVLQPEGARVPGLSGLDLGRPSLRAARCDSGARRSSRAWRSGT